VSIFSLHISRSENVQIENVHIKCGIYTQWNSTQPWRRMKSYHLQVNGTGEHHPERG
jgi:hypothetical protein